ncbi:MAG: LON peptidase substrate-binding domain-containing protein [Gammaproteobacteria bacterium]|nr:LON peptidase substrate-binding domain-containing protein [Gammaproteobacteria bacterium]
MTITIPLFPLNTVLFPQGVLPLRIFEPRYLDMISDCLKNNTGIGVVLIREGKEVGAVASAHDVGTLTEIHYWHKRNDGLLGVTLKGTQRFQIHSTEVRPNQLLMAEVEILPDICSDVVPEKFQNMTTLLQNMISQLDPPYSNMTTQYDDAAWVSSRLAELLPLPLNIKQALLLEENINERLRILEEQLTSKEATL